MTFAEKTINLSNKILTDLKLSKDSINCLSREHYIGLMTQNISFRPLGSLFFFFLLSDVSVLDLTK